MTSIRRQLLQRLLIGMAVIASVTGVLLYRHVHSELDELYNGHLHQLAMFMAHEWQSANPSTLNAAPANPPTKARWEEQDYLVQLWRSDGVLLTQQKPAVTDAEIPLLAREGLFRQQINKESWRVYRADSADVIVQIAQPEFARTNTARETSMQLLMPLVLQVPLLLLVAWWSVRRGLKPLQSLSQAIGQRHEDALAPVDSADQPEELQPLVNTLNGLLARLESALEQQKHFVADAAHELRTPLAALQLQLDLLQRATLSNERDQAILQLRAGLHRTTHLAQQLLAIAQAESGLTHANWESVDCASIVKAQIETYLPLARARDLDLGVTRLDSIVVDCVRTDLEAVVDNLISNAIRYTPRGGRIDVAVFRDRNRAAIEVTDSGHGIPEQERARIFDRFYRAPRPDSDVVEGSGLGLAIVKTICDRYRAEIQISDGESGAGARFTVFWPLETSSGS